MHVTNATKSSSHQMRWIYISKHTRESFINAYYVLTTRQNPKQPFLFIFEFIIQILLRFVTGTLYRTMSNKSRTSLRLLNLESNKRALKDKSKTSSKNAYILSAAHFQYKMSVQKLWCNVWEGRSPAAPCSYTWKYKIWMPILSLFNCPENESDVTL